MGKLAINSLMKMNITAFLASWMSTSLRCWISPGRQGKVTGETLEGLASPPDPRPVLGVFGVVGLGGAAAAKSAFICATTKLKIAVACQRASFSSRWMESWCWMADLICLLFSSLMFMLVMLVRPG
jgi:hypothetical protein